MSEIAPDLSKLKWRCRRGTKELDTLTLKYLNQFYSEASLDEQCAFSRLLEKQDPELHEILTRVTSPDDPLVNAIVDKIYSS